jgi:SAM-dependent methyltransferase
MGPDDTDREGSDMDLETYRETSLQTWDQMAPGWEDKREWLLEFTGRINDWLLDQAQPQPGQSFLDVAAGTGDLGFAAAERVGADGKVLCTDFSPEMIEAARRNGERQGLSNVEYRVLDAERMDLDDDSFDGVLCRWGYMLMADPAAALSETRRVLREGGTLAFAVWQTPDRNPWAAIPGMTLVQRGHMPPPEPGAPGIFAMGEADRVIELVTGAGFEEPQLEELAFEWRYSGDDLWETITRLAGPLATVIKGLPEEEQQQTRAAIEENAAQYRENGELVVPAACWGVTAR